MSRMERLNARRAQRRRAVDRFIGFVATGAILFALIYLFLRSPLASAL